MIMIVPAINIDILGRQGDVIVQLAGCSSKQPPYYKDISFSYLPLPNREGLAYPIDKVL